MKILVVEDEELVRWFLVRALRKMGHEVKPVANGREAFKIIENGGFDVLMTDLRMPEENGALLINRVRELPNSPKLVVCSAYITGELSKELESLGICTLKKPFTLDELKRSLVH